MSFEARKRVSDEVSPDGTRHFVLVWGLVELEEDLESRVGGTLGLGAGGLFGRRFGAFWGEDLGLGVGGWGGSEGSRVDMLGDPADQILTK